jgi:hypothetical protein
MPPFRIGNCYSPIRSFRMDTGVTGARTEDIFANTGRVVLQTEIGTPRELRKMRKKNSTLREARSLPLRKPECSLCNSFWTPAFAGVSAFNIESFLNSTTLPRKSSPAPCGRDEGAGNCFRSKGYKPGLCVSMPDNCDVFVPTILYYGVNSSDGARASCAQMVTNKEGP